MVSPQQPQNEWPELEGHDDSFVCFTIYERPLDYPKHFVVRRWAVASSSKIYADVVPRLADSLEDAREHIPSGLVHVPRGPEDDPTIYETWV